MRFTMLQLCTFFSVALTIGMVAGAELRTWAHRRDARRGGRCLICGGENGQHKSVQSQPPGDG